MCGVEKSTEEQPVQQQQQQQRQQQQQQQQQQKKKMEVGINLGVSGPVSATAFLQESRGGGGGKAKMIFFWQRLPSSSDVRSGEGEGGEGEKEGRLRPLSPSLSPSFLLLTR